MIASIVLAVLVVIVGVSSSPTPINELKSIPLSAEKLNPSIRRPIGENIVTRNFNVRVDHFRATDPRTAQFTYYANADFYENYFGPIYIYLKDGGDFTTQWIEEGLMVDVARETGGILFTFDFRYFGDNILTESASFEDFQYLTPEQILQDIASFISQARQQWSAYFGRVIIWGSGYGGTVATWARKKFPHLIDAAWSSSGVFEVALASLNVYDTLSYTIYSEGGADCRNFVQSAFEQLELLAWADDGEGIRDRLGLCEVPDVNDAQEMGLIYQTFIDYIIFYIENNHAAGVRMMCADLAAPAEDALASFGRWAIHVTGQLEGECNNLSFERNMEIFSNTEWNQIGTQSGRRQLYYLQCTQTGLFQITDPGTWLPNHIELAYHVRSCQAVLGPDYDFNIMRQANVGLIESFGSLYQRVQNTIYTNGYIDPWLFNGIIYSSDYDSIAFNIEHYAKSADLTSISTADSISVYLVKQEIHSRLIRWSNSIQVNRQSNEIPQA